MKKTFLISLFLLFALILCACGTATPNPPDDRAPIYEEACSLLESGNYLSAADKFEACSDYLDSQDLRTESQYLYALELLSNDEIKTAKKVFSSIKNYKNSSEMVSECDYLEAVNALNAGKLAFAISKFKSLATYKDSEELLRECQYQTALEALKSKEYSDAGRQFEALGEYKDSKELAQEAKYQEAFALLADKKAKDAFFMFSSIPEYQDVPNILSRFVEETKLNWMQASQTDNLGNTYRYTETYEYDVSGVLLRRTAKNGSLIEYSPLIHAWMAQPTAHCFASTEIYEYKSGKLIKITGRNGSSQNYVVTYSYNDQDQVLTEDIVTTNDSGQMTLSYDNSGNLVKIQGDSNHGVTISISYDSRGNIASVYNTVELGYRYTYAYTYDEEADRILEVRVRTNFGGDYTDHYFYNSSGLVSEINRVFDNGSPDISFSYSYNNLLIYHDQT